MFDLTGFQRDLLYVTVEADGQHGLGIKTELETHYPEEIPNARIYPNLDALAQRGLLSKSAENRRTNAYSLTERGMRELIARQRWEEQYIEQLG